MGANAGSCCGCCCVARSLIGIVLMGLSVGFLLLTWCLADWFPLSVAKTGPLTILSFGFSAEEKLSSPWKIRATSTCVYACFIVGILMTFGIICGGGASKKSEED